jgi:hypothetical protein
MCSSRVRRDKHTKSYVPRRSTPAKASMICPSRIHQGFCVLTRGGNTDPLSSGRTAGTKPEPAAISGGNTNKPTNSRPTPARLSRSVAGHQDLGIKLLPVAVAVAIDHQLVPPKICPTTIASPIIPADQLPRPFRPHFPPQHLLLVAVTGNGSGFLLLKRATLRSTGEDSESGAQGAAVQDTRCCKPTIWSTSELKLGQFRWD